MHDCVSLLDDRIMFPKFALAKKECRKQKASETKSRHAGTKHGLQLLLNAGDHIVQNLLNLRKEALVLLTK